MKIKLVLLYAVLLASGIGIEVLQAEEPYRLCHGNALQIYIETITELPDRLYPVYEPSKHGILPPQQGYVFLVREDGTIVLPNLMHTLNVEGMTVLEAQSLIRRAYVDVLQILSSEAVITVSLISPESITVKNTLLASLDEPYICNFKVEIPRLTFPDTVDYKLRVPLQSVLNHIHEKTTLPVVISDEALTQLNDPQQVTIHAHMPFTLPLKNFLEYLVRQVDLAWHFKDGTINITTTDETYKPDGELTFRVYFIRDLARYSQVVSTNNGVRDPADLEAIASYIRTMVEPKTWDDERFLRVDYNSTIMYVNQTESVHEQIANLLIFMRKCQIGCPSH